MIEASQFIAEMKEAIFCLNRSSRSIPEATIKEMALETYQRALKVEEEMKGVSEDGRKLHVLEST